MPAQDEPRWGWSLRRLRRLGTIGLLLSLLAGCTRRYYRDFADRDVYRIEQSRQIDWRSNLPPRPVEADLRSRIGDKLDPNFHPIPTDDPGARPYQVSAGRPFEFLGWKKRGFAPVEDLSWVNCIPRDKDGLVLIDAASAMRIGLLNNRDYQTQVENVYIQALGLTLLRFTYFPQFASNQQTEYFHTGAGKKQVNQLQLFTQNSLSWTFYSGANLLVNFANNLVFGYNGHHFETVNSNLLVSLTQPLLRGAWARNVTQPLSVAERGVLYTVRAFAEYRRQYYVSTVTNYLQLLLSLQTIRNQEKLLEQTKRNLDELDAAAKAGLVDTLQRDQLAQNYQLAKLNLLQAQASYQTSLDIYRVSQLGLPPDFPVKIDETLLKKFELSDSRHDTLRADHDELTLALLQFDEPPEKSVMADAARKLLAEFKQLREVSDQVKKELAKWRDQLEKEKGKKGAGPGPTEDDERESDKRQRVLSKELTDGFTISRAALLDNIDNTEEYLEKLDAADPEVAWLVLRQDLVARDFRARLAEQFVIETQARVYLIEVNPVEMTLEKAISVALANRLDLMSNLAQVTDAWRNVEFDANQLLAGLNLVYTANLNSPPNKLAIIGLNAHNSSQLLGIQFQAPIVRRGQRNQYRLDQIQFQRARRDYMLNHDTIVQAVRLDMRNLNLNRRQFEIQRESLLIAARQVDSAEFNARTATGASSGGGQSVGLNLNTALNSLLNARNGLISEWIQYETSRLQLFRDFDTMNIDAQGVWTNDDVVPTFGGEPVPTTPDPLAPPRESLLPPPASTASPFARP